MRVTTVAGVTYLEFLQVRTSGRYRADVPVPSVSSSANTCPDTDGNTFANENVLQFGVSDTCMTTIGALPSFGSIVANSDLLAQGLVNTLKVTGTSLAGGLALGLAAFDGAARYARRAGTLGQL